jgi:hypothetical protein
VAFLRSHISGRNDEIGELTTLILAKYSSSIWSAIIVPHDCDHDQARVPTFWNVIVVVEDCKGCNHVGKNGWRSTTSKAPCGSSDPSYSWYKDEVSS